MDLSPPTAVRQYGSYKNDCFGTSDNPIYIIIYIMELECHAGKIYQKSIEIL